jgi:hypothetical protein
LYPIKLRQHLLENLVAHQLQARPQAIIFNQNNYRLLQFVVIIESIIYCYWDLFEKQTTQELRHFKNFTLKIETPTQIGVAFFDSHQSTITLRIFTEHQQEDVLSFLVKPKNIFFLRAKQKKCAILKNSSFQLDVVVACFD